MTIHSLGSFNVQKIQIDGMEPNLIGSGDVERPTWRVFLGTHFTGTRQAFNILFAKFESKSHNGLLDKFYNGQIRSCHLLHSDRTDRHVAFFVHIFEATVRLRLLRGKNPSTGHAQTHTHFIARALHHKAKAKHGMNYGVSGTVTLY